VSPPGRPKGECRSARHEGNPVSVPAAVAAALAYVLALAHKMLIKDRLTRDGRWNERTPTWAWS
jgi:hypothetical protein